MADPLTIALVVGATASVAGVVQNVRAGRAQERQVEIRNRIEATKRIRNIKRAVAASRVRRGEVESAGFELGVTGGTAAQGASFGVTAGLASSVSASNQQFTGQQAVGAAQQRASQFQQSAATFGAISNLASQFGAGTQGAQNRAAFSSLFDFGG